MGVAAFAARELAPYADAKYRDAKKDEARRFLRALADVPARDTVCRYDARDVARFAQAKYGTIERLNAAWPVPYKSFFDISFSAESLITAISPPLDMQYCCASAQLVIQLGFSRFLTFVYHAQ